MLKEVKKSGSVLAMSSRSFLLLILLLSCTGCAAVIYALVWFQMLQFVIASSELAVGILMGTFIGGMGLGSVSLPAYISGRHHPLRVFALFQLGIGILAILALLVMPYVSGPYLAAVCVLPPALLMGAVLPIIERCADVSRAGFCYAANLVGAALGCLLAGFYLLRFYDVAVATYVASAISAAAASASIALYLRQPGEFSGTFRGAEAPQPPKKKSGAAIYAAIALSGLCAMGAAVAWNRLLALVLGGSIFTFSIVAAVFLLGLGIGGSIGSALARRSTSPRRDFGVCQMLLTLAVAWAAYALTNSIPYWPIDPILSESAWITVHVDLSRCMWAILPATILWGASLPLALAAHEWQQVNRVFAANAAGAAFGALAFGTQYTQQTLIGLSAVAALLMLAPRVRLMGATVLLAAIFAFDVPAVPDGLIANGRFLSRNMGLRDPQTREPFVANILYAGSGANASVAVTELPSGYRNLHVNGRVEASNQPQDVRLRSMLGHLSSLYHPRPRSVLVVGFGSGVTAGTFTLHPSIQKIVICESEPLILQAASRHFGAENYNVLQDRRVEVVYDNARQYILTTQEKFDVITSSATHPWVKGAATLYTREYLETARRHLNPGGVLSQWLPLHETSIEAVKSQIATFFEVFPDGTIWGNDIDTGVGYDIMLLGKNGTPAFDLDDIYKRLNSPDHLRVAESIQGIGFRSVAELFASYAGRGPDLLPWLADAAINRDRNLSLQYLAGMAMNVYQNQTIYNSLIAHRRFPGGLFSGSDAVVQVLRDLVR